MKTQKNTKWITLISVLIFTSIGLALYYYTTNNHIFDGERALKDVIYQVSLGPRIPGSQAHERVIEWIREELDNAGWESDLQNFQWGDKPIKNIISKRGQGTPWIIIGAHYDSRIFADKDPNPEYRSTPVPGANDGASGVSILLELARSMPEDIDYTLWFVFFDAEDNGNIAGWDWIMGSQLFAAELTNFPDYVVIIDMVGDRDLNIFYEKNSDTNLSIDIWRTASNLGYQDYFIPAPKHSILDDHTPFIQRGITAIDIIDFDYEYHHTVSDTPDKVSAKSLSIVGETLYTWLLQK